MPRKESRTDHVLNLITGNEEEPVKKPRKKKATVVDPDEKVQQSLDLGELVKSNLEEAISDVKTKAKKVKAKVSSNIANKKDNILNLESSNFTYINVMENLVKMQLDEVMQGFDICNCDRCKADVIALSLSNLPPKYVVTDKQMSPLLNYYSSKFYETVNIEIMKACTLVSAYPHHSRS